MNELRRSALLLKEQVPAIAAMLETVLLTATPLTRKKSIGSLPITISEARQPSQAELLTSYTDWCGSDRTRYSNHLPMHFFSHWALPVLTRLVSNIPANAQSLLNQGVRVRILKPIPRNAPFHVVGRLEKIEVDEHRCRAHSSVIASSEALGDCLRIDSYTYIPRAKIRRKHTGNPQTDSPFETLGTWSADQHDGLRFAMLTGDFNPIHTSRYLARGAGFKNCILHGFGQLARSFEVLQNAGWEVTEIDVRFIKPLVLPADSLQVQIGKQADPEGRIGFRLCSEFGDTYMTGVFVGSRTNPGNLGNG